METTTGIKAKEATQDSQWGDEDDRLISRKALTISMMNFQQTYKSLKILMIKRYSSSYLISDYFHVNLTDFSTLFILSNNSTQTICQKTNSDVLAKQQLTHFLSLIQILQFTKQNFRKSKLNICHILFCEEFNKKKYLQLMSSQQGGILQMSQSFNYNRDTVQNFRGRSIDPSAFSAWQKNEMYKSSYAKFHSPNSVQPKNTAIPGYGGFVPGIKAENIHAKGFANIAKQSFSNQNLGKNVFGLSTTGFNVNKEVFVDNSKLGSSSKYGKSAIQKPHPNWNNSSWCTTTQQAFRNPNERVNPTYRQTDKFLQTQKQKTKNSGFATNYSSCDGKGWNPDPILKGDNKRTQYRDRFNKQTPFHRNTFISKVRKLQGKQMNYKYN